MYVQKRIEIAINEFEPFSQGNYVGIVRPGESNDEKIVEIYYYGSLVFTYNSKTKKVTYDFCGYEGYSKTTRLINHCLRTAKAPFIVSCAKKKINGVKIPTVTEITV